MPIFLFLVTERVEGVLSRGSPGDVQKLSPPINQGYLVRDGSKAEYLGALNRLMEQSLPYPNSRKSVTRWKAKTMSLCGLVESSFLSLPYLNSGSVLPQSCQ